MTLLINLLLGSLTLILVSCNKDDSRLEEVSGIQSQKQIEEENKNFAAKAESGEAQLKRTADFYNSLVGDYQGEFVHSDQKWIVELTIQPNYMPSIPERVRSIEAIDDDIKKVSLNVLIKRYIPKSEIPPASCKVLGVQPQIVSGKIFLASNECSDLYEFKVSDNPEIDDESEASELASSIYFSKDDSRQVPYLKGKVTLGFSIGKPSLLLKRVDDENTGR